MTTNAEEVRELIINMADLLSEDEAVEEDGSELGFTDQMPENDLIYMSLSTQRFRNGHLLVDDEEQPLPGRMLRGYIEDVYYDENYHDTYGLQQRLRVIINAGGVTYMMNSGLFAVSSRNILSSLAVAEKASPNVVYGFEPYEPPQRTDGGSTSDKVIFVNVYEESNSLISETYPSQKADVVNLLADVQEAFGFDVDNPEEIPLGPDAAAGGAGGGRGAGQQGPARQQRATQQSQSNSQSRQSGRTTQSRGGSGNGVKQKRRAAPSSL